MRQEKCHEVEDYECQIFC